jgi:hypothetical protein
MQQKKHDAAKQKCREQQRKKRAKGVKFPVYFPDDVPSFYRPAGWDADLFPTVGEAKRHQA